MYALCHCFPAAALPVMVGGCVRDIVLGRSFSDIDIEVFGAVSISVLLAHLSCFGTVIQVGHSFPVFKWTLDDGQVIDVALPRRERQTGLRHGDFDVAVDPDMTFEEAAWRRDFTMNAMGVDLRSESFLDPYDGRADLQAGLLRHVSPKFSEDALRVFRAMQFVSRFQLTVDADTFRLCEAMDCSHLPRERVCEEFRKLLMSDRPSLGLSFLKETGQWRRFPELMLAASSWESMLSRLDMLVALRPSASEMAWPLMLAALGLDMASESVLQSFLARLTADRSVLRDVMAFWTAYHRLDAMFSGGQCGDGDVRRLVLAAPMAGILALDQAVCRAQSGVADAVSERSAFLKRRVSELGLETGEIVPLVTGQQLLALGVAPGPGLGQILDQAFEAQLDGVFSDEAGARLFLDSILD